MYTEKNLNNARLSESMKKSRHCRNKSQSNKRSKADRRKEKLWEIMNIKETMGPTVSLIQNRPYENAE